MFGKDFPEAQKRWKRLTGDGAMGNDGACGALGLNVWKTQIDRADKLFGALSSEEVLREIAPGRNRVLYLWGPRQYIRDFERLAMQTTTARELYDEMLKLYPDWINRGALWSSVRAIRT
jgi:hypothetical protein